jgi:hypothetical protein
MPSKSAFMRLKNLGINLTSGDYARYNYYDTMASQKDLEYLYEVLFNVKDCNNNPCVFTAVSVVANPNFVKIRENDFQKYFYEPFTMTLERYYPNENVFGLWKEGIKNQIFIPQFHGREHLNISAWLKFLRIRDHGTISAFNESMWGFAPENLQKKIVEYQAAFQISEESDLKNHRDIIIDGLELFHSLFGYRAKYFVPPNGVISNELNKTLVEHGIKYRSSSLIQQEISYNNKSHKVLNWSGKKDSNNITYIIRNCLFEPNKNGKDWIDTCLNDIKISFKLKKPAIISSHRVNYIGVHDPSNRDNSLKLLKTLLLKIRKEWSDVEFMTTDKLGDLINSSSMQQKNII